LAFQAIKFIFLNCSSCCYILLKFYWNLQ